MKLNIQLFASGTITFATVSQLQGKIVWSSTANGSTENTSTVVATIYARRSSGTTTGRQWNGNVNIGGNNHTFSQIYTGNSTSISTSWKKIYEFSNTIAHELDGTKSINISGSIKGPSGTSLEDVTSSGGDDVNLDTIPRASSVTATDANIGSATTITINKNSDKFYTSLYYKTPDEENFTLIVEKTYQSGYGWTVPTSFYSKIPNSKTLTITLQALTYSYMSATGEYTYVGYKETTFIATAISSPTLSLSVIDIHNITTALTGDSSVLIKYKSTAQCTWSSSANNSASISSNNINCVNVSTSPYSIPNVSTNVFTLMSTDSRGYSNSVSSTKGLINYVPLTIYAKAYRPSPTSGQVTLEYSGNFYNGEFQTGVSNELTLSLRYRLKGATDWTIYGALAPTISGNKYSGTITLSNFIYTNQYEMQLLVYDGGTVGNTNYILSNASSGILSIPKGEPIFDWGENDFNVNGTLNYNGVPIPEYEIVDTW